MNNTNLLHSIIHTTENLLNAASDPAKKAQISNALSKIKEYSESATQNLDTLFKIDAEVLSLDDSEVHEQVKTINKVVEKTILTTFLSFDSKKREAELTDPQFRERIVRIIKNADQNEVMDNQSGDRLIHRFARDASPAVRRLMLICIEAGCNVDAQNKFGNSPLHFAARYDDEGVALALIKQGANTMIKATDGNDPLMVADVNKSYKTRVALGLVNPSTHAASTVSLIVSRKMDPKLIVQLLDNAQQKLGNDFNLNQIMSSTGFNPYREVIIRWILEHPEYALPFPNKFESLEWLANKMFERNFTGDHDEHLLSLIIDQGFFSSLRSNEESLALMIVDAIENGKIKLSKESIDKVKASSEAIQQFSEIFKQIPRYYLGQKEDLLHTQSAAYAKIEQIMKELKAKNFPHTEDLLDYFKRSFQIEKIMEYRRVVALLESDVTVEEIDTFTYGDIFESFAKENRWEWIAEIDCTRLKYHLNKINKLVVHLLMDKLLFKESTDYTSFTQAICARGLIRALEGTLNAMAGEDTEITHKDAVIQSIQSIQALIPRLKEFIVLCAVPDVMDFENNVIGKIRNLNAGEFLLIPTGCKNHATCLMVKKASDESFDLTQYNTGAGVEKHHKGKELNKFQTYDTVANVPVGSLLNHTTLWANFRSVKINATNMDSSYHYIHNRLGRGGTRVPSSQNPEDYESKQASGTCAMQSLMAMLRHQLMQLDVGTAAERKALYVILKTKLMQQFHLEHKDKVNEVIQRNLVTVLPKLDAKWSLLRFAESSETFEPAFKALIKPLGALEAQELRSRPVATNLSRYAALKAASDALCKLWLDNAPEKLPEGACYEYALAKLENTQAKIKNIKEMIESISKNSNKNLANELYHLLFRVPHTDLILNEAVIHFGAEKEPYKGTIQFLSNLNLRSDWVKDIAVTFIEKLRAANHIELADIAQKKWDSYSSASPASSPGSFD